MLITPEASKPEWKTRSSTVQSLGSEGDVGRQRVRFKESPGLSGTEAKCCENNAKERKMTEEYQRTPSRSKRDLRMLSSLESMPARFPAPQAAKVWLTNPS